MQVRGASGERLNLLSRAEACPATGACVQRQEDQVVVGDLVLASAVIDGFRCAYVGRPDGLKAGFLPDAQLEPADEGQALTAEFLAGTWRFEGENSVSFREDGGRVIAKGEASYGEGASTNLGAFEGPVTLNGPKAAYAGEGCEVTVTRRGPYLVVNDNGACGGMNVSFDGVYVRSKG